VGIIDTIRNPTVDSPVIIPAPELDSVTELYNLPEPSLTSGPSLTLGPGLTSGPSPEPSDLDVHLSSVDNPFLVEPSERSPIASHHPLAPECELARH